MSVRVTGVFRLGYGPALHCALHCAVGEPGGPGFPPLPAYPGEAYATGMPDPLPIADWLDMEPTLFGPTSESELVKRVLSDRSRESLVNELRTVIKKRRIELMELRRLSLLVSEIYHKRGRDWDTEPLRQEINAAFFENAPASYRAEAEAGDTYA
jgi:hypothetical protein